MNQKAIIILFVLLATVGLGITAVNSLKQNLTESVSDSVTPTPTPEGLLFNQDMKQNQSAMQDQVPAPQKQVKQYRQFPGPLASGELVNKKAVIETGKGKIEFEIYPEATKAASNFIFLSRDGFYNGLTFHRVEPGFVIQGGDPRGDGTGGPGYKFEDEEVDKQYLKGTVAMANSGPDTNGSQFFIMLEDNLSLPPKYTIFGKVREGLDVVEKIKVGDIMHRISIESLR